MPSQKNERPAPLVCLSYPNLDAVTHHYYHLTYH